MKHTKYLTQLDLSTNESHLKQFSTPLLTTLWRLRVRPKGRNTLFIINVSNEERLDHLISQNSPT